jgi:excinuclease ABC subunit C
MEQFSDNLNFEEAARLRDQIQILRKIQERQYVSAKAGDLDIVAVAMEHRIACIQVFRIRGGLMLDNQSFFPQVPDDEIIENVMSAFLTQHYLEQVTPREIIVSCVPTDAVMLEAAFSAHNAHSVKLKYNVRGVRARWLDMAINNAQLAVSTRLATKQSYAEKLQALQEFLGMNQALQRMECFDVSHTSGELPVASCVVFDANGPRTAEYRRFNIENITSGDDYAALAQALQRRYRRIANGEIPLPDLLCIDGGKGQLTQAETVLRGLGINIPMLLGIAKGIERKPGLEQLWLSGHDQPTQLSDHAPALHLIQQLRDEAHRFALTGHRRRRAKAAILILKNY